MSPGDGPGLPVAARPAAEQRGGADFEQGRVLDSVPQRLVHERQGNPGSQAYPGGQHVPAEGGRRKRNEGALGDVAEDNQPDEENYGLDQGHAPPDSKGDGGDDDQQVDRNDQVGRVGIDDRDGAGGQRLADEKQHREQAASSDPGQGTHRGARDAAGPAQHDGPGVTAERKQDTRGADSAGERAAEHANHRAEVDELAHPAGYELIGDRDQRYRCGGQL